MATPLPRSSQSKNLENNPKEDGNPLPGSLVSKRRFKNSQTQLPLALSLYRCCQGGATAAVAVMEAAAGGEEERRGSLDVCFGEQHATLLDEFERLTFEIQLNRAILRRSYSEPLPDRFTHPHPAPRRQHQPKCAPPAWRRLLKPASRSRRTKDGEQSKS